MSTHIEPPTTTIKYLSLTTRVYHISFELGAIIWMFSMINIKRTKTGIEELDKYLEGGFPKGSMNIITGNPGTGKTILCSQFLVAGVELHEDNGLYVSLSEGRDRYITYMNKAGLNIGELVESDKILILDLLPSKSPGVDMAIQMITETIIENNIQQLVIDNYSAIIQSLHSTIESRITLQLLCRVLSSMDCTTLIVIEKPFGIDTIGSGVEEFISDGIIELGFQDTSEERSRIMNILKMKGTSVNNTLFSFIIENGIKILNKS